MRGLQSLCALPASLLALISLLNPAHGEPWHSNLQPQEKYFPEHEQYLKHEWEIMQKLQSQRPVGIRKMMGDPGEKFFLDYWEFGSDTGASLQTEPNGYSDRGSLSEEEQEQTTSGNESYISMLPPFLVHTDLEVSGRSRISARNLFERDFKCPAGTSACSSIGQPNSCCGTDETCVTVENSPVGPVGCCPAGETCNGAVASCNTAQGYTSCPNSSNGGCCIPGFACQDVGCVLTGTQITTTSLPVSTVTSGVTAASNIPASSASTTTTTQVVSPAAVNSVQTVTTTIIISPSTSAIPTTVTQILTLSPSSASSTTTGQGPLTCTTGYQSCPASLGGGCCPTDRACGSPNCPPLSTAPSTAPAVAPVRPTSDSSESTSTSAAVVTTSTSTTSNTVAVSGCPTGFYMCSAYYMGGCCQVDRNCDTTSCPAKSTVPVVTSTSITVVAASTGASGAAAGSGTQGSCQSGWFTCDAGSGGGCCPSGFVCGASCTATVSGQSNIGKESPNVGAEGRILGWTFMSLAVAIGTAMVVL